MNEESIRRNSDAIRTCCISILDDLDGLYYKEEYDIIKQIEIEIEKIKLHIQILDLELGKK